MTRWAIDVRGRRAYEWGIWSVAAGAAAAIASSAPGAASAQAPAARGSEIIVTAPGVPAQGSAADGYRVNSVTDMGVLGDVRLQDAPYSVSVVPGALIRNVQASSPDDIFRVDPYVHGVFPSTRGNPLTVVIRGFTTTTNEIDNLRLENAALIDVENLERVEVVTGLAGFLYGPAAPGGLVNYVLKRPTLQHLADVTAGDYGAGSGYVHGDFGGRLTGDGKLAFRLNALYQDGDTALDRQSTRRYFVSGALDWRPIDDLLLQFDVIHSYARTDGADPFWSFSGGALHPAAPDADKNWGEPWAYTRTRYTDGEAKATWRLTDAVTFRGGFLAQQGAQDGAALNNLITNNSGTYRQQAVFTAPGTLTQLSGYGLFDVVADTGLLHHKFTFGYFAEQYRSALPLDATVTPTLAGAFNFTEPHYVARPAVTLGTRPESTYFTRGNGDLVLGDVVDLGEHWSAIVGLTYADVMQRNFTYTPPVGQARVQTAKYDQTEVTPSGSLIYKPFAWFSTYATYIQGLEQGGTAPAGTSNVGFALPPEVDEQYEVGAKATVGGALLTLALFDITKAYDFIDPADNTYKQDGREEHRGVELGVTGKVTPQLTVFGGATVFHARVTDDPKLDGTRPIDVPEQLAKLYAEYAVARIPGLTLTGGVYYTGRYAALQPNTQFLPDVVTGDLGLRYETAVQGVPIIARVNVTNVADTSYWMSTRFLGRPRTAAFSLEGRF